MAVLKQSQTSFARYLIWFGTCDENEIKTYDIKNQTNIIRVTKYTNDGTRLDICDKNVTEAFWDFSDMRVGNAYEVILSKGDLEINIPNCIVTNIEESDSRRLTYFCEGEQTPTPTPFVYDCCQDMTSLGIDETQHGVTLQMVGDDFVGSKLCFNVKSNISIETSENALYYYAKTETNKFLGTISIDSETGLQPYEGFASNSSGRFVFKLPSGICYEGDLQSAEPDSFETGPVFTKISESLIDGYDSYFTTPTPANYINFITPTSSSIDENSDLGEGDGLAIDTFLSAGRDSYGQLASEHDGLSFNGSYIPLNSLIAIGKDHLIYTTDGEILYGAGLAESGQLGNNHRFGTTESSYDSPDIIDHFEFVSNIRDVHICGQSTFVVTRDDKLWSFGKNTSGELATNKAIGHITQNPTVVDGHDVKSIFKTKNAPTINSTLYFVNTNGEIFASGYNGNKGILPESDNDNYLLPVNTNLKENDILNISNNQFSTLFLKTDGTLFIAGNIGKFGNGGLGDTASYVSDYMIPITKSISLNGQLEDLTNIIQIATNGENASIALTANGLIYSWGYSENILGIGDTRNYTDGYSFDTTENTSETQPSTRGRMIPTKIDLDNVKFIAMTNSCCFAIKHDGTLWSWGDDISGESGLGFNASVNTPQLVNLDYSSMVVKTIKCGYDTTFVERSKI